MAVDGKCLEGLDLARCQYYGQPAATAETAENEDDAAEIEQRAAGLPLNLGTTLEAASASGVLRRLPCRVVALIGAFESGKTSLIAGMFDRLQMGELGKVAFAGSSTLPAFEQACHDARVASLRNVAHSPRTGRGEARFYHLDLRVESEDFCMSLLIGDRSGEEYEEVRDDLSNAEPMFEMRRAQCVGILVDGERLCHNELRHEVIGAVGLILQGLLEANAIVERPRLAVILTKNDTVLSSRHAKRAGADFTRIMDGLRARHSARFLAIEPFVTAASPKNDEAQRGTGLAELLDFWVAQPERPIEPPSTFQGDRMFHRFFDPEER